MEKKLARRTIMRSVAIQQVNDATIVMRHFIELSARLLPFFNELSSKEHLLPREASDRKKIIEVFESYNFDTSTSLILMDSTILDSIKDAFSSIEKRIPGEVTDADSALERFLNQHQELVKNWQLTDCN